MITEGVLSYKLKFPFNEFVNSNILMAQAAKAYEPKQTLMNQGLPENDNENVQFGSLKSYEPQILDKKQEVTLKNATSLQIGDPNGTRLATHSCCFGHSFPSARHRALSLLCLPGNFASCAEKIPSQVFFHARLDEFLLIYSCSRKIHLRSLGCTFFAARRLR
jgi:hypothetical protein